ncbi:MAG: hypothetical protein QXS37_01485 [Candidatus Aenigmatarchaeota archaeon]
MPIQKTRLKKIGGLWRIKKGLKGTMDLGLFGKKQVVILLNEKKQKKNQPDYYLYFDTGEAVENKKTLPVDL